MSYQRLEFTEELLMDMPNARGMMLQQAQLRFDKINTRIITHYFTYAPYDYERNKISLCCYDQLQTSLIVCAPRDDLHKAIQRVVDMNWHLRIDTRPAHIGFRPYISQQTATLNFSIK